MNTNEKIREALEEIIDTINEWRTCGAMEHWQYSQLFDIADAALALPRRNCDVYSYEEALQIWNELPEIKETKCFDEWLYAEAKESLNK